MSRRLSRHCMMRHRSEPFLQELIPDRRPTVISLEVLLHEFAWDAPAPAASEFPWGAELAADKWTTTVHGLNENLENLPSTDEALLTPDSALHAAEGLIAAQNETISRLCTELDAWYTWAATLPMETPLHGMVVADAGDSCVPLLPYLHQMEEDLRVTRRVLGAQLQKVSTYATQLAETLPAEIDTALHKRQATVATTLEDKLRDLQAALAADVRLAATHLLGSYDMAVGSQVGLLASRVRAIAVLCLPASIGLAPPSDPIDETLDCRLPEVITVGGSSTRSCSSFAAPHSSATELPAAQAESRKLARACV